MLTSSVRIARGEHSRPRCDDRGRSPWRDGFVELAPLSSHTPGQNTGRQTHRYEVNSEERQALSRAHRPALRTLRQQLMRTPSMNQVLLRRHTFTGRDDVAGCSSASRAVWSVRVSGGFFDSV